MSEEEAEYGKYCPLRPTWYCSRGECAWWVPNKGCCVRVLGEMLDYRLAEFVRLVIDLVEMRDLRRTRE